MDDLRSCYDGEGVINAIFFDVCNSLQNKYRFEYGPTLGE